MKTSNNVTQNSTVKSITEDFTKIMEGEKSNLIAVHLEEEEAEMQQISKRISEDKVPSSLDINTNDFQAKEKASSAPIDPNQETEQPFLQTLNGFLIEPAGLATIEQLADEDLLRTLLEWGAKINE